MDIPDRDRDARPPAAVQASTGETGAGGAHPAESGFRALPLLGVVLLSTLMCFTRLGARALWQDEGETAVLATSILSHGVPLARVGGNLVLQDVVAYDADYRWTFHPWGSFYLAAAGIGLGGRSEWAARLPFAACGVLATGLLYVVVWRNWRRTATAALCSGLLALSVPFALHARQCRYYSASALSCLIVVGLFLELVHRPSRRKAIAWAVALALQFYVDFGTLMALLPGMAISLVILRPARSARPMLASGLLGGLVACVPGLLLHGARLVQPGGSLMPLADRLVAHLCYLDGWFTPVGLLVVSAVVLLVRGRAGWTLQTRTAAACGIILVAGVLLIAVPATYPHIRYMLAQMPLAKLVEGVVLMGMYDGLFARTQSRALAAGAMGLVASVLLACNVASLPLQYLVEHPYQQTPDYCTESRPYLRSDLAGMFHELSADFVCPNRVMRRVADDLARPGEMVLVNYGDLPLMFHRPDLVIRGGVGGGERPVEEGRRPDLVLLAIASGVRFQSYAEELSRDGSYVSQMIGIPRLPFGNIPEPRAHHYGTPETQQDFWVLLDRRHADRLKALPSGRGELLRRWTSP